MTTEQFDNNEDLNEYELQGEYINTEEQLTSETERKSKEILSALLSYASKEEMIPELVEKLMRSCGSLSSVFEAPYSLLSEAGLNSNQVVLLKMIPPLTRKYLDDKYFSSKSNGQIPDLNTKIITAFLGVPTEKVIIILRDKKDTELYFGTLSTGSLNASEIYIKRVMELALRYNAKSAIIAHNHPSGIFFPSQKDIETTIKIKHVLKAVNVRLENHYIIAGNKSFSMAESEEYYEIFI